MSLRACILAIALVGCSNRAHRDQVRTQWLDSVTPCPAPATCTGKATDGTREIAVCSPTIDPHKLVVGDVIVTHELAGAKEGVGRIELMTHSNFTVQFPDGWANQRPYTSVVQRACK